MLGTQFEPTDARRMFPCWDEPSFRARFQLTAVVPENFLAVSNMPVESETKSGGGKEVRFAMTPSMSSYLNVFVAGELDLIEMKSGDTQIRVITTKGKAEMGRYALEASAQICNTTTITSAFPIRYRSSIRSPSRVDSAGRWKLGRHHLLRVAAPLRSQDFFRCDASGHL